MTEEATGPAQADARTTTISSAEQLAAVREQRGMGKGEVAQRLKLHPRQLDAIERGDWAALPGRAFVRGCIRSYGRLLGVAVEPLLESVGGFAEAEDLKPTSSLARPMPRGGAFGFEGEGKGSRLPWALLGVIGVIAVALFFGRDGDVSKVTSWIGKTEAPTGKAAGDARPASPPVSNPLGALPPGTPLVPPPLIPAPDAPTAGPAGGTPAASTPATPATPATPSTPAAAAAVPAVPPPPSAPIRLTVRQDAWVDVRQADGKSVFTGIVKPGTPTDVKGAAPFSVTIGNADKVTLEFEGKPVDLKPVTAMPNNVAKVKLP